MLSFIPSFTPSHVPRDWKTGTHADTGTCLSVAAALVTVAKGQKQPKCSSATELVNRMQSIPVNGILLSHKEERISDTYYNMDKPEKCGAE